MKRFLLISILALLIFTLFFPVAALAKKKVKKALSKKITVTSTSFKKNEFIPVKHAYGVYVTGGENVSPQLSWKTKRKDIKSFALLLWDKHPIAEKSVHWCVINIPASVKALPEGASKNAMPGYAMFDGGIELMNVAEFNGYVGPYPPEESGPHEYEFRVIGLNAETLDLSDCTVESFTNAVKKKTLAKGKYLGKFEL